MQNLLKIHYSILSDLSLSAERKAKLEKFQRELAEEEEREKQEKAAASAGVSLDDIKAVLREQLAPIKSKLKEVTKEVNQLKAKEIAKNITSTSSANKKDTPKKRTLDLYVSYESFNYFYLLSPSC